MPRKIRQLKEDLRRAGFVLDRTRGSHAVWKHPLDPRARVTISGHDGDDVRAYQESEVRRAIEAIAAASQSCEGEQ